MQVGGADSLDRFQEQNYYEPATVRDRDRTLPQFARTATPEQVENTHRVWPSSTQCGPTRPFQPTASFQCLRDSGKLSAQQELNPHMEKKYLMPGYTGFIRGSQHISGRTFGETTRRAYDVDYREHVCTSPIPSSPQANRKIELQKLPKSFMYGVIQEKPYHPPGYTGHVPGARKEYARSYGEVTRQQIAKFSEDHPRGPSQEQAGHAYTSTRRQFLHVDSAPIPGKHNMNKPVKLIPKNTKYLKYYAN